MRLQLDEDMPHVFRHYFPGYDVRTVRYMGWDSKQNSELLALARDAFDVLITLDQRIPYQQNLTNSDVGVIVLIAITDNVDVLRTLVPQILETLASIERGEVVRIHLQR